MGFGRFWEANFFRKDTMGPTLPIYQVASALRKAKVLRVAEMPMQVHLHRMSPANSILKSAKSILAPIRRS